MFILSFQNILVSELNSTFLSLVKSKTHVMFLEVKLQMCPGTEEHHTDSGVILARSDVELEDDVLDKPLDVVVEVHGVDGGGCVQHEDDVRWLAARLRQRLGLGALRRERKRFSLTTDSPSECLYCLKTFGGCVVQRPL